MIIIIIIKIDKGYLLQHTCGLDQYIWDTFQNGVKHRLHEHGCE